MPEHHPGLIRSGPPDDPTLPLKVVKVNPPDVRSHSRNWDGDEGRYTVYLDLSRKVTRWEEQAMKEISGKAKSRMSLHGSTLTISNTTLESIAEGKASIASALDEAVHRGREAAEASERRRLEAEADADAEDERLRRLAESIAFD